MKPEVKFTKLFIDNEWVDAASGKTFPTFDPATEQEICKLAEGDKADVDKVEETEGHRPNGFLGLSLNDRTILFLVILVDKTVSV